MSADSRGMTLPLAAGGTRLQPLSAVLMATLLGVALQWVIARVYSGLIVETFGGARVEGVTAGIAIPLSYLFTAIATFACAVYCEKRSGASRVVLVIHLAAVIIPLQALVAAQFELARPEFAAGVTVAYLGTIVAAGLLPEVQLPRPSARLRTLLLIGAVFLSLYVMMSLLRSGGLARLNFDLSAVYEVREEYVERLGPLIGYLVPWQGYVLNPALILIAVRRRSLLLGFLGLVMQRMAAPADPVGARRVAGRRRYRLAAVRVARRTGDTVAARRSRHRRAGRDPLLVLRFLRCPRAGAAAALTIHTGAVVPVALQRADCRGHRLDVHGYRRVSQRRAVR